jgi:hypothetical protein
MSAPLVMEIFASEGVGNSCDIQGLCRLAHHQVHVEIIFVFLDSVKHRIPDLGSRILLYRYIKIGMKIKTNFFSCFL